MITITCEDNMEMMARYPDKHFELAIVDPPWGMKNHQLNNKQYGGRKVHSYDKKINEWDVPPKPEYFKELFRVSQYQIIWGGNHFELYPVENFVIYHKLNVQDTFSMAMCEYGWTNLKGSPKIFSYFPKANPERFHPTEKPVKLYKWLLSKYAKPGDKILDTHLGSGSIAIACHDLNYDLTACELDTDYYNAAMERLRIHRLQQTLDFTEGGEWTGKIILDLCGGTGSWSKPYKEAGYDVRLITLPEYDVRTYEPPENVYGILAAPPCTEFSLAKNRDRKLLPSMEIVNAVLKIIKKCNPVFYCIENPRGMLKDFLGPPDMKIKHWQYGTKTVKPTHLWGKFNRPTPLVTECPEIKRVHRASVDYLNPKVPPEYKDAGLSRAALRAITPPGFARAFFEANP